jgi:D-sedoheptulose 7-phosphate isomerase
MDRLCDVLLKAPAATTCAIQELHLPLYHAVCALVEDATA